MKSALRWLAPLALLALLPVPALAAGPQSGRVVAVIDGDTLQVDVAGRGLANVHLAWIDAPERAQEAGEASRASLGAMAFGQEVRLESVGEGPGGTLTATVWAVPQSAGCRSADCPKTLDLGMAQLTRGMAWHDRRALGQPPQSLGQYEHAEFEAKVRRIGLWGARNPVPPWQWRAR